MILRLFRRSGGRETIERLYGVIVAQSRDVAFYTDFAVPDSVEGRFEMIVLHGFLFFHRLKSESEDRRRIGQQVFDAFCSDMDSNLREMGVGDLSVPKKMKKMAEAFYGRTGAYDASLDDPEALAAALARNIYGRERADVPEAAALASYVIDTVAVLASVPFETFAGGDIPFPAPSLSGKVLP